MIAAVVILYFPDTLNIRRNILSYAHNVGKVLVINNAPTEEIKTIIASISDNIVYIENEINNGVAQPLNFASDWAFQNGFKWLLTMDQDSYFNVGDFPKYLQWLEMNATDAIAVVGIPYANEQFQSHGNAHSVENVNKVITSGSLINLSAWRQINGFNEALFIDEVDHEYCYRALSNGFQIIKLNLISLVHSMGKRVSSGYFNSFKIHDRMIHAPIRVYYIVRNYLSVRKKFKVLLPDEFKMRDNEILVILKNNLFFGGAFWTYLKMAWRGYLDYRNHKMGKFSGNLS